MPFFADRRLMSADCNFMIINCILPVFEVGGHNKASHCTSAEGRYLSDCCLTTGDLASYRHIQKRNWYNFERVRCAQKTLLAI